MGVWKQTKIHRLLVLTIARVLVYLFEIVVDALETYEYHHQNEVYFFYITAISLVLPTAVNTVYMVSRSLLKFKWFVAIFKGISKGPLMVVFELHRQLELMHCLAKKLFHKPCSSEMQEVRRIQRKAQVIEFFEDFYGAFPMLVLNLYILFGSFDWIDRFHINKKPTMDQLILPTLSMLSMLIGLSSRCASETCMTSKFTTYVSFVGWLCIIISRVIVLAFVASYIRFKLAIICLIHVSIMMFWISSFVFSPGKKNVILAILVLILFAIPSLIYYPLMFEFKDGIRPYIYLTLLTFENFLLLGLWSVEHFAAGGGVLNNMEIIISVTVIGTTIIGDIILVLFMMIWYRQLSKNSGAESSVRVNMDKLGYFQYFSDIVFFHERRRPRKVPV